MRPLRVATALALAVVLFGAPTPARACENAVELTLDQAKRQLVEAEKQLQLGNARKVLYSLQETSTHDEAVNAEIDLVVAVAGLRVGLDNVNRGNNPAKVIRLAYEAKPEHPKLQALYAESLLRGKFRGALNTKAAQAKRNADALRLLADLESRDLLPNAHAWAVLSRAHRNAGQGDQATAAHQRCLAVAIKQSVCKWALGK